MDEVKRRLEVGGIGGAGDVAAAVAEARGLGPEAKSTIAHAVVGAAFGPRLV